MATTTSLRLVYNEQMKIAANRQNSRAAGRGGFRFFPLCRAMLRKVRQTPLGKEIAIALAIKTALLFVLWYAFFSQPLDKNLTPDQVGTAVLARQGLRHGQ